MSLLQGKLHSGCVLRKQKLSCRKPADTERQAFMSADAPYHALKVRNQFALQETARLDDVPCLSILLDNTEHVLAVTT